MSKQLTTQLHRPTNGTLSWLRGLLLIAMALSIVALPGCSGCSQQTAAQKKAAAAKKKKEDDEKKKKKKKKPDYDQKSLTIQPGAKDARMMYVKPGHWLTATQTWRANNFNFTGELGGRAVEASYSRPILLEKTPYQMSISRPAPLPKGQVKHFEMTFFVPRRAAAQKSRINLNSTLRTKNGARRDMDSEFAAMLHPSEYLMVVLAKKQDAYSYLQNLDSSKAPWKGVGHRHYLVVRPKLDKRVPLPTDALSWTSIAYLVWDDIDPTLLNPDQQRAMIDWLHWGGQIIINGPRSLATLRDSFLADYLPATAGETFLLDQTAFDEVNRNFIVPVAKNRSVPLKVVLEHPPEGIHLKLTPGSEYVFGTGKLLADRQIGRGRIVVSGFSLTSNQIRYWQNFDGLWNACVLRRPPRKFEVDYADELFVDWTNQKFQRVDDARLVTRLRYFSRDMGFLTHSNSPKTRPTDLDEEGLSNQAYLGMTPPSESLANDIEPMETPIQSDEPKMLADNTSTIPPWKDDEKPLFDGGHRATNQSGVAGWNDLSGSAYAARRSLKDAAGIAIPEASFVLKVLSIYLVVLVPLNWLFFRLIRKVEWAWVAAPLIAIGGALAVINAAQLDIGFARSRTDIGVLELQGSHGRGHLTRYTALYTSLSTNYDIQFDNPHTQVLPFITKPDFKLLPHQPITTVNLHRDNRATLRGFNVKSNTTGMLHSEQMYNLGGGLELTGTEATGWKLVNHTGLTIHDVGIIRGTAPGKVETHWIGELIPDNEPETFKFGPITSQRAILQQWDKSNVLTSQSQVGNVNLHRLLDLARDPRRFSVGQVRLVGWTDTTFKGMTLKPKAAQVLQRTLVVANLQAAQLPQPKRDVNTRWAVKKPVEDDRRQFDDEL